MNRLSNEMADLAEEVKEANAAVLVAQRTSVEQAMRVGRLLVDAKERCGHGNWLPFLERALIGERSARNYMTLARSGLEIGTIADLGGIAPALAFLREWKLPEKGQTTYIFSKALFAEKGLEAGFMDGDVAFVFPTSDVPDRYDVSVWGAREHLHTKHPMTACIHVAGEIPVNTIIHWLTVHFDVPIDDWHMETASAVIPNPRHERRDAA